MVESDIHKLLLSFGMLPMNKVLKELEDKEDYSNCISLRDGINSFKSKFSLAFSREKSIETEEEYFNYYLEFSDQCGEIIKSNMKYYIKEIKEKLKL